MLFSSYYFIFIFLPISACLYTLLKTFNFKYALIFLTLSSLFFYSAWNFNLTGVLLASVAFNFCLGLLLRIFRYKKSLSLIFFILGIFINLGILGFFKYTNFILENGAILFGYEFTALGIILPLGISFFTFQQIAYLVGVKRGEIADNEFLKYIAFVTFFPQLIAGPIVRYDQISKQFDTTFFLPFSSNMMARGITLFSVGLFKKVVIADGIANYSTPVFDAASAGVIIKFLEGWTGALAYTFQIYFDFSGYSDMALGLGLIFGFRLPINFKSPYKSKNLIYFWRSWHITLSEFLRDYLYIPLGGSKRSVPKHYFNLLIVMLLGGLWHGAAWTFIVWGALHGCALIVNNLLRGYIRKKINIKSHLFSLNWLSWLVTFIFLVITWVFFRAPDIGTAINILSGMFGFNGISLPVTYLNFMPFASEPFFKSWIVFEEGYLFGGKIQILYFILILMIVLVFPNSSEFVGLEPPKSNKTKSGFLITNLVWKPTRLWGVIIGFMMIINLVMLSRSSEFLYFQF